MGSLATGHDQGLLKVRLSRSATETRQATDGPKSSGSLPPSGIGRGMRLLPNQLEGARTLLILLDMNLAEHLQARIRADLKLAMVGRRTIEVRALRSLLGAIDNAQAAPVGERHDKYVVRAFGDPGVEVPRLDLSSDTLDTLLRREHAERDQLAGQMTALGREDHALALKEEAAVFERYLAP